MIPFKDRVARAKTFLEDPDRKHSIGITATGVAPEVLALVAEFVAQELPQMERRVGDAERRKAAFDVAVPDFDPATNVSAGEPELPGWLPPDHFFAAPATKPAKEPELPLRRAGIRQVVADAVRGARRIDDATDEIMKLVEVSR